MDGESMYYDRNLCDHIRESESQCLHCPEPRGARFTLRATALLVLALGIIALLV